MASNLRELNPRSWTQLISGGLTQAVKRACPAHGYTTLGPGNRMSAGENDEISDVLEREGKQQNTIESAVKINQDQKNL